MSIHILATGNLIADPRSREGQKGAFTTATIRVNTGGDDSLLVNVIAFKDRAERLLELRAGDALSVSGRGSLRSWTGRDGVEKHGLNVTADQIATARPKPKKLEATAERQEAPGPQPRRPAFDDAGPF